MEKIFILNFGVCAVLLASMMTLGHFLFKSLKKNYAAYYKTIGKPIIIAPVNLTEDSYRQLLRGGFFGWLLVFRGLPKDFPQDSGLRKVARAIRGIGMALLVLFVALIAASYLFYKSGV